MYIRVTSLQSCIHLKSLIHSDSLTKNYDDVKIENGTKYKW